MDSKTESVFLVDAGYVSSELEIHVNKDRNILLTAKRKNMKGGIETVFDVLK
jgi:hypothetical protein